MTAAIAADLSPRRLPPSTDRFVDAIRSLSQSIGANASALDHDGAFPADEVARLATIGALTAPFPLDQGGLGMTRGPLLRETLSAIGHGSLVLGRLFEGHVNAIALIERYGTASQLARAARDAGKGRLFGVWNTEAPPGLRLLRGADGWRLEGGKTFASGAGFVARPLVTAMDGERQFMVLPRLEPEDQRRADLSSWQAHGMRASATGSFDFSGLAVDQDDLIGDAGDYHRQPAFSAGAWRFAAVQLGGIERIVDELRGHLAKTGRGADPHQRARVGAAVIAAQSARLWVERACEIAEEDGEPERGIAYVNLTRLAVERAGLDVLELAQRSIGLAGFHRAHPIEQLYRDLATYLRQPAPDRALDEAAGHVLAQDAPLGELW
ncbi:acyl-CoA/acyl-ACP dehydrogenase [Ancylobacter sp. A5.8]|uniref:acyl-CoA dehydrogenase family protein n=1 Tax=Ancylobacter gelatini TaxID=2919920 RepID=UPI001F4D5E06|nr:acyl-CoA dehydrogenase family protein [Ancylobacter gelatini]MCJ8142239.1 acyl-CoA/acyl-ACP dehydrogenase [Ancylobacter gelatini]